MLGIGFSEMVLIAGFALIVIGPEKFPDFAKLVIRTIRDLRGYVDDVKREVAKELKPLKEEVNALSKIDPEKYIDSLTKEAPAKPANPSLHEEDRKVMEAATTYEDDPYGWEGNNPGGYDTDAGSAPEATVGYGEATSGTGEPDAEAARSAGTTEEAGTAEEGEGADDTGTAETVDGESAADPEFEGLGSLPVDNESDVWTGRQSE